MPPRMFPAQWTDPRSDREAERMVYDAFAAQLPDGFTIIHNLAWLENRKPGIAKFRQIDLVVCHPAYGVIVVEVKGGQRIWCDQGNWYCCRRDGTTFPYARPPFEQARDASFTLYQTLRDLTGNTFPSCSIVPVVCFPEIDVVPAQLDLRLDRDIVIDRRDLQDLSAALLRIRRYWRDRGYLSPGARRRHWFEKRWIEEVCQYFVRDVDLRMLLGPTIDLEKRKVKALSEEQANILDVAKTERRFAVAGCAGSGKTLLAMGLARRLAQRGNRVLLCCYNRPLRDHLVPLMADVPDVYVLTFHQLCRTIAAHLWDHSNTDDPDVTAQRVAGMAHQESASLGVRYDAIVVDEGQDFAPDWWTVIERLLAQGENSPLYVFYDDNQRLYHRQRPLGLPNGLRELPLTQNFRTTQEIHQHIVYFYRGKYEPLAIGPSGRIPKFYALDRHDITALRNRLMMLLQRLHEEHVSTKDIVILTPYAEDRTLLVHLEEALTISGVERAGYVLWQTIYRFKGLERPVVIVVELDRQTASPQTFAQLLYVAYSRASSRLIVLHDATVPDYHIHAIPGGKHPQDAILESLNDEQCAAVTAPLGRALVWAGAGTGKTRVLTRRIAYLLDAHRIDPTHILAVTFTTKAAKEMRERLAGMLGEDVERRLHIGTFHAMCRRLLCEELGALPNSQFYGRRSDFTVLDERAATELVKTAVGQGQLIWEAVKKYIDQQKQVGRLPHECFPETEREEAYLEAYQTYQSLLERNNSMDFDDLILLAVRLLKTHPAILSRRRRRWVHILVDEFQDTNRPQFELIELLADHDEISPRSLFVVGDAQQSIYSWRGAEYTLFTSFTQRFPDAQEYRLTRNYRSTLAILDAALEIGQRKFTGVDRLDLIPDFKHGGLDVMLLESQTVDEEVEAIGRQIQEVITTGRLHPRQIAVLLRALKGADDVMNTIRKLEAVFKHYRIPFVTRGIQSFYRNPIIHELTTYLRAVCQPHDDTLMAEALRSGFAPHVGPITIDALCITAQAEGKSLWTLISENYGGGFVDLGWANYALRYRSIPNVTPSRINTILEFVESVIQVREALLHPLDFKYLLDRLRAVTRFDTRFRTEENSEQFESLIATFTNYINRELDTGDDLGTVLRAFALFSSEFEDVDATNEGGSVNVMSIHAAKGLEFYTVYLLGLEEGTFPSARSMESRSELEEEGRVCYVAYTRAQRQLIVSRVESRDGQHKLEPSRFFEAIRERVEGDYTLEDEVQRQIKESVQLYQKRPATIQLDATKMPFNELDFEEACAIFRSIPGGFPVEMLVCDENGDLKTWEFDGCIRADADALALLQRRLCIPVRVQLTSIFSGDRAIYDSGTQNDALLTEE